MAGCALFLIWNFDEIEAAVPSMTDNTVGNATEPCEIYAVMAPENAQDDLPASMSAQAVEAFFAYRKTCGGKGAFAIADNGAYGMSWKWEAKAEAERIAMSFCAEHAQDAETSNPPFNQCRITAMYRRRDAPLPDCQPSKRRAITCAWISAAPSKMLRMRASHNTRLILYSSAKPLPP